MALNRWKITKGCFKLWLAGMFKPELLRQDARISQLFDREKFRGKNNDENTTAK